MAIVNAEKIGIVWFRNDLRLHDNEALHDALDSTDKVIPMYVLDERIFFGKTKFGFEKTGKYRAQFLLESVADLRDQLASMGSNLLVRTGKPEEEIAKVASTVKCNWVFCNRERTQEEVEVQDALEQNLWEVGVEVRYSRGKMLYYTSDLPFPVTHTPDTFTHFRKEVEKYIPIRNPLPSPDSIPTWDFNVEWGDLPTMKDLGKQEVGANNKGGFTWKGGESEALLQLKYYLWDTDHIAQYKETRNGLLGRDFSSKFSPWLAAGCLSPKLIYRELKNYEQQRTKNKSTYWLFFELLWRDFFRLMGKKHGNQIFKIGGTKQEQNTQQWSEDRSRFDRWANAETGIPFIDANMKELNETGFMSNRGRQNVASFLVKDLKINWQMGAEYFESLLIDYDPCSNYGNWNYVAGVGSDPREDRYFNIISQAKRYDSDAAFVKYWLPELKQIPSDCAHTPDRMDKEHLLSFGVELGENYPLAMVPTKKWK